MGLSFLAVGSVCLYIGFNILNGVNLPLWINGIVFSILGVSFTVVAAVSFAVARFGRRKAERLMRDGTCYNGEIVRVYDNIFTQINRRHPIIVECLYKDNQGKSYLVKSGNTWPDYTPADKNGIKARVWVNPNNPRDYFVEVLFGDNINFSEISYDYDYR